MVAEFEHLSILDIASPSLPSAPEQVAKLQAGQYQFKLTCSVPCGSPAGCKNCSASYPACRTHREGRKLRFGCNLLQHPSQKAAGSTADQLANTYTLIATQLEGDESSLVVSSVAQESDNMSSTTEVHTNVDTTVIHVTGTYGERLSSQPRTSELIMLGKNDDIVEQIISLPPAQPASRIEDSVEALDKLEEELEALDDVTVLRGLSLQETKTTTLPSGNKSTDASAGNTLKRAGTNSKKTTGQVASSTPNSKAVGRASSVRRPVSLIASAEVDGQPGTAKTAPRRSTVARPTSLLPPKPPAKSTKPPTLPTFELPGEAVARRLKEQREARRSQQVSSEDAAALAEYFSPAKPHFKSSKPPTRPTFELPGEAISRRKREEREAKLRAEEEEERKRREFKARPIRSSAVPSSYPRETVASRARQSKMLQPEASPEAPSPSKRHSIAVTSMARATGSPAKAGPLQASSAVTRGRASLPGSPSTAQMSRTTSTSTGSMHGSTSGQRSTVSSEDAAHQRLRGKQIYSRDNGLTADRVRERRDREEAAKTARQQAAERSRQLSREWAEKQRAKAATVKVTVTDSSGRSS